MHICFFFASQHGKFSLGGLEEEKMLCRLHMSAERKEGSKKWLPLLLYTTEDQKEALILGAPAKSNAAATVQTVCRR